MSQGGGELFGWMGDISNDISMHNHKGNMISQHILHFSGRRMSAEAWAGCRQTGARWNPFSVDWFNTQRTAEGKGGGGGGRTKLGVRMCCNHCEIN